jgi:hypothetical protein
MRGRLVTAVEAVNPVDAVCQREPEELATAHSIEDDCSFELAAEVLGTEGVAADGAGIQNLDAVDPSPGDPGREAAAHDLDFGEFGQG